MYNEKTWKDGEKLAKEYMQKSGYKILYTNFSCAGVELDIVAIYPKKLQQKELEKELKEKLKNAKTPQIKRNLIEIYKNKEKFIDDILVITEVKSRSSNKFGIGAEAVGLTKQKNIIRGAKYLSTKDEFKDMQFRFDVASVDGNEVTYIENAFLS